MINIESCYKRYENVIQEIGEDRINNRYEFLYEQITNFINNFGGEINKKLHINERVLMHCVLEYFEDILKVKSAHGLDHTNSHKVNAYLAFWLLRRHPIQVLTENGEDDDLVFANEKFVLTMLMSFLIQGEETRILSDVDLKLYQAFVNSFYYYLKFRELHPQAIEMILLSFRLGGVYPDCKDVQ